jgi:hypothetical protein
MKRIFEDIKLVIFWGIILISIVIGFLDGLAGGIFLAAGLIFGWTFLGKVPVKDAAVLASAAGMISLLVIFGFFPESELMAPALMLAAGPALFLAFTGISSFKGGS